MPEYEKMCMDCGKILTGPGTGEHNPNFRHTDVYKGIPHTTALCDDCARERHKRTLLKARHRGKNFLRANRVMGVE